MSSFFCIVLLGKIHNEVMNKKIYWGKEIGEK